MAGAGLAQGTWVEEVGNTLAYYQTIQSGADWTPYIDELTRARDGLRAGDQLTVTRSIRELQKMLRLKAHGIDRAAAEDLYNLTLTIQPVNERALMDLDGLEPGRGGLMTVPAESVPYGRTVHCHEGGCDYWIDTVFDLPR